MQSIAQLQCHERLTEQKIIVNLASLHFALAIPLCLKLPFALWLQPIAFFVFYYSTDGMIQLLLIRRLKACKSAAGICLHLQFSLVISKLNLVGCICRPMKRIFFEIVDEKEEWKQALRWQWLTTRSSTCLPGQYDPCGEQVRKYFLRKKTFKRTWFEKGFNWKLSSRLKKVGKSEDAWSPLFPLHGSFPWQSGGPGDRERPTWKATPPPPPLTLSTLHRMPPPPIPSATFFSQHYTDCIVMYQKDTTNSLSVVMYVFSSDLLSNSGVQ